MGKERPSPRSAIPLAYDVTAKFAVLVHHRSKIFTVLYATESYTRVAGSLDRMPFKPGFFLQLIKLCCNDLPCIKTDYSTACIFFHHERTDKALTVSIVSRRDFFGFSWESVRICLTVGNQAIIAS